MATDFPIEFGLSGQPSALGRGSGEGARSLRPLARIAGRGSLYVALALQGLGALFFVGDLWSEVLGLRTAPIPYEWQEMIQLLASVGLVIGLFVSALYLRRSHRRVAELNRTVDVASGNFSQHLLHLFAQWDLSDSERSVAVYAMKGFSNGEIARLRGTSASTVKSQMNAVYRKSGLNSRGQLIACLVEELFEGVAMPQVVVEAAEHRAMGLAAK
ncbi:helix-turn-helix transcriptional regulator [Vannielia litorea]|uniref:Regulatory protein, luxR family n=1 Tax=Vannielia litorea TaxID=1217970 RepID=A0A1N6F6Y9_9RHOB|nr:helix-turn-helix transcriptional regulator [Vannielia litorea]SIN90999.1 regulatory protein, luxR family [Vannielia litorea]